MFKGLQSRRGHYQAPPLKEKGSRATLEQVSSGSIMGSNSGSDTNTASSVPFFTPVTHPVFKSVEPVQVSLFPKDRERYEQEVLENGKSS